MNDLATDTQSQRKVKCEDFVADAIAIDESTDFIDISLLAVFMLGLSISGGTSGNEAVLMKFFFPEIVTAFRKYKKSEGKCLCLLVKRLRLALAKVRELQQNKNENPRKHFCL